MNLFKLKKDGKTVGYLKINDYIWWSTCGRIWLEIHPQEGCSDYFEDDHEWDEAHPYVCDDKNGDKVFSGDEVRHNDFDNGAGTVEPLMMSGIFQGWTVEFYFPEDTERNAARIGDSNDIELIKEKP